MTFDDLLTNKYWRFIFSIALFFVIWYCFKDSLFNMDGKMNELQCEAMLEARQEVISGTVITAFYDENDKSLRKLVYLSNADTLRSEVFFYEVDDFFDFIRPGDSIRKVKGSLDFFVFRERQDTIHLLHYNCKN